MNADDASAFASTTETVGYNMSGELVDYNTFVGRVLQLHRDAAEARSDLNFAALGLHLFSGFAACDVATMIWNAFSCCL
jgi:hypothetical protein